MPAHLTYPDALAYLYGFTDYEKKVPELYAPEFYDLGRMVRLLALLGDPHRAYRIVHVAGTKGKGSTAAIAESVLRAAELRAAEPRVAEPRVAGRRTAEPRVAEPRVAEPRVAERRTALYTSPHLHTFRERIQAGGRLIPEADVARLVGELEPLVAQVPGLTTFEIMTGLALKWFAEQAVEWAVLEVGLGGRLDATNVVGPAVTVITPISYDHTAILGNTLAEIAAQKAGIVKPGVPAISAPQPPEALAVIEAVCRERGAPLTLVGRDWTWEAGAADLDGQSFTIRGPAGPFLPALWLPLLGEHQLLNATTAVAALAQAPGLSLSVEAIRRGLAAVRWPARLEILNRAPLLVVDSAHNGDSAEKLRAALGTCCPHDRLLVVLGGSADHVTPELLRTLLSGAAWAVATRSRHPRAADPAWLQAQAAALGLRLDVSGSVAEALDRALALAGPRDLVCCTGSVFVAAEARVAWFVRQGLPLPPSD